MKRLSKKLLAIAAIAVTGVAAAAVAAVIWAVATTGGTRWLLASLAARSGGSFSVQKVEGRMVDHLLLTKVRVGMAGQKAEIDTIELRWKPLLLLSGTVAVQELVINGVRIQDDSPPGDKPPVLAWPELSKNTQLFDAAIARLQVTNLSYRRLQEQPLRVTSLAASVTWQDGLLSIGSLKVESPSGRINGGVSAGFSHPFLTADLAAGLPHPVAGMDRFVLQIRPGSAAPTEQVAGAVTVVGSAGGRKMFELGGDVGLTRTAFNLRGLRLTAAGRQGVVTADGSLALTSREPVLTLQIKASGLNLAPELNMPTDLSGILTFAGTTDSYRGHVTLANRAGGWRKVSVSAAYHGTGNGVKMAPLTARVLDGTLAGNLDMDWRNGFALRGAISGRNLNPARLDPGWEGGVNFSATGTVALNGKEPAAGNISITLRESRLHGQELTGGMQAAFARNTVSISRLALQGKGFDLHASGELNRKLALAAQVSDLSRLVPGAAGALRADGWVCWRNRHLSGAVAGTGSKLAYGGTRIAAADLVARLDQGPEYPLHVAASLRDVTSGSYLLNAVTVAAEGTLRRHTVDATLRSAGATAKLALTAGYRAGLWSGDVTALSGGNGSGPWSLEYPSAFVVGAGKFTLSPLSVTSGVAERFEAAADLALKPLVGQIRVKWAGMNLARANPYLKNEQLTGSSNGSVRLDFLPEKQMLLAGSAAASGVFSRQGGSITFEQSSAVFEGNRNGMKAGIEIREASGGRVNGTFSSSAPLRLAFPEKGKLTAEMSGIDLALLKPWLPADTRVAGLISGSASGNMLPGQRFELDGTAVLAGGAVHKERGDGGLDGTVSSATASWKWRGEALSGALSLHMSDNGQARGTFTLPVPARFPVAADPKGALRAELAGQLQDKGVIAALFPGMLQKSFGKLDTELTVGGTWEVPQLGGKLGLAGGGAYLPAAGIHLRDVQLAARLEKNLIIIDSFRGLSGSGHIEGTALVALDGWRLKSYQGVLRGEKFQTVYFPELQIVSSPELSFEGTPQKLTLRGELRLPELHFYGAPSRAVITPSGDVIMEGVIVPAAKSSPLALDVKVRVQLGDQVFVKVAGIDARLGGAMDLSMSSLDRITSSGEITVVKGRYRTYGVDLEIVRGRLFFSGGAINHPTLDFMALRTVGDVRAGVTVTGTLQKPVTRLYSEPVMPDVDILAYIVLGHPYGNAGEQAGLVSQAAAALLTSGQAAVLQEQLKNQLGLSTLEIQGGVGGNSNSMGYKPLQVTAPGSASASQQAGITETVLTVGKYLTPQLYISYGKSLFTGSNLFRLRYDIFRQWQIETQTGAESGADLFYKLEFK